MSASYDNLLPQITAGCLVVWAGFTMPLSLAISLKQRADIQLHMSTSQAEMQTFLRRNVWWKKNDFSYYCEDKVICGIYDRTEISTIAEGAAEETQGNIKRDQKVQRSARAARNVCCFIVLKVDYKFLKARMGSSWCSAECLFDSIPQHTVWGWGRLEA